METEQGPAPSVEDRAAAALGFSPLEQEQPEAQAPEQPAEAEAASEPETIEWEYEGEKYAVPKKLEKALMQERDYTQKAQEVADLKRTYEVQSQQIRLAQEQAKFQQSISKEMRDIGLYEAALQEANNLNWQQMSVEELVRKRAELDQWSRAKDDLIKSVQQKYQEYKTGAEAEIQKIKASSDEAIRKRIPSWNADLEKSVREAALKDGYLPQELDSVTDPRHRITLWKAHMYDVSQQKASEAKKVVQSAIVQNKGSKPMDSATKEMLNYRKEAKKLPFGSRERSKMAETRLAKILGV